ncbi:hypothetical protein HMPREF1982_02701 [Clostridiales bacterium oral taxon 876 str. F0540]|nr:hypothetical protein HMPREF1982_02701 [Clostridiales bacterium oral taxon 876 str. F0540]
MLEVTALLIIGLLYIIPLNLVFYQLSNQTVMSIVNGQKTPFITDGTSGILTAVFYVVYVGILFLCIYLLLKYIVVKSVYVYLDNEIEENKLLAKYTKGQRNINAIGFISIVVVLFIHILAGVFDIKIIVLAFLCLMFVFRTSHKNSLKQRDKREAVDEEIVEGNNSLLFEWTYNMDPLNMQQPVRFVVSLPVNTDRYIEYKAKDHNDNMPQALREHVLDGICPEVVEFARQVKRICVARGFTTFHQASVIMAFQQSLKYVLDIDSKNIAEYLRYPLETIVDREGDCDCHSICSAAILYAMGYDVVLLRITFPEGEGHLALAVEGAEGIPGNFLRYNNRNYYYCEVTPLENSRMSFRVGEMPDMPGANITVVPIKEVVSNM